MTPGGMMIAEFLALRSMVSALAREVLLASGSEAFFRAEAQAVRFIDDAAFADPEMRDHARKVASEVFANADGVP